MPTRARRRNSLAREVSAFEDVENERRQAGNEYAWQREYLLHIVPDEEQAIHCEWIQYYDGLPSGERDFQGYPKQREVRIGVDLAISKRGTANYIAMVPALLYGEGRGMRIYILPNIVNRRMTFPETVETCKVLYESFKEDDKKPNFVIEDVAYQKSLPQQLENEDLRGIKTTRPGNQDKRTRLVLTAYLIKTGKILFPREGADALINQLVHFGVKKHDDMADAFSIVIHSAVEEPPNVPRIVWL